MLALAGCTISGGGIPIPSHHTHTTTSEVPTSEPTSETPTSDPTSEPTSEVPTSEPTSEIPTSDSTSDPTSEIPTSDPTSDPTSEIPTSEPTSVPTSQSTSIPTTTHTSTSTSAPTSAPTSTPTSVSSTSVPSTSSQTHTVTVEKTSAQIVEENDYTISSQGNVVIYQNFNLNEDIEVSTSGGPNCGSFWWTPDTQWRLYQNKGGDVTIASTNGYNIESVKLSFLAEYNGALYNGSSVVASDDVISVNDSSITLTVSGTGESGQIRITQFSVTYQASGGGSTSSSTSHPTSVPTSTSSSTSSSKPTSTSTSKPTSASTSVPTSVSSSTSSSTPSGDKAKYTILVYMCGSDLESGYASQNQGLASSDLKEMLDTANQPDDVNIVIETGGASKWSSNPGVNKNYLQRYHIRNQKLVLDSNQTKANMGLSSTLQSFITWGVQTYPAEKTGLIFWNHGGAVAGCCYDENYSDDSLLASEMASAYQGAFSTLGVDKLEWVGYDCCIMSYADLAAINSQYFNYMVSSQELESGYGWDYDAWLPTLYSNSSVSTDTLLSKICDTFVSENGGSATNNDQCLSVLDLSKMDTFVTAFDTTFAGSLTSSDWSKLKSTYTSSLRFANISDYGTEYGYGLADMKDFLTRAKSSYSYNTTAALTALDDVVIHSSYGGFYKSTKPCGLNIFIAADNSSSAQVSKSEYGTDGTLLTNWRNFVVANGTFYSSSSWSW